MGLMNKLKNILFEEEEVEIPVIEKKEKKVPTPPVYQEVPKKEEVKAAPTISQDYNNYYQPPKEQQPERVQEIKQERFEAPPIRQNSVVPEKELSRSSMERTFNFPDFDEEEFESFAPRPKATNVLEYERKKVEKRVTPPKVEKKEEKVIETVKFRPSPIISPVYGILDKNYTPDEITSRSVGNSARTLDVDSVRKKAFGGIVNKSKAIEINEQALADNKILEEKLEKARTIDELLNDSIDDVITLPDDEVLPKHTLGEVNKTYNGVVDSLEDINESKAKVEEEDTLESDLFDLIDSMYESREDGE